jgi:hypothetical protein
MLLLWLRLALSLVFGRKNFLPILVVGPFYSNNLDTRIDFKTTNLAGSLTVIRDGSAEFKGAEKACIYFGGHITPQDGFQIVPSDSASQVRLGKKFEHYPTCPALSSFALIHICKVKRTFVREKSDRSSVTI